MKHPILSLLCLGSALLAAPAALDQKPEAVSTTVPYVPRELSKAPGEVLLLVDINAHGYVTGAVVKSSTNPALERPCLEAVHRWKYVPAKKDGQPISATFLQPIRFGDHTIFTEAATSAKPKVKHSVDPEIPESLEHVTGQVSILVSLSAEGKLTNAVVQSSTHEELSAICLAAVRQWTFTPAIKEGNGVPSSVHIPFIIQGKPLEKETSSNAALVDNLSLKPLRQPPPEIPSDLKLVAAEAEVLFTVDPKGYVAGAELKSSTNPVLGELARTAVLGWKFKPVVKDGVPQTVKAVQPFKFGEDVVGTEKVDRLPSIKRAVDPVVPESLKGVKGQARVLVLVGTRGEVLSAELRASTLPEFEAPVLAAVRQWTFNPAVKGGVSVESRVMVPVQLE